MAIIGKYRISQSNQTRHIPIWKTEADDAQSWMGLVDVGCIPAITQTLSALAIRHCVDLTTSMLDFGRVIAARLWVTCDADSKHLPATSQCRVRRST